MHLSDRMAAIASICLPAGVLADVGCDHAYLSIHTVLNKKAEKVIATDLREGPLKKAEENVKKYRVGDKVDIRLGYGLDALSEGEADAVLISGMGGLLICDILAGGMNKINNVKQLILQPQSDLSCVRHFLHRNGFRIEAEKMCEDSGKFYTCMRAVPGTEAYQNEYEYEYGKILLDMRDETLFNYISRKLEKTENIIVNMETGNAQNRESVNRILNEKERLIAARACYS